MRKSLAAVTQQSNAQQRTVWRCLTVKDTGRKVGYMNIGYTRRQRAMASSRKRKRQQKRIDANAKPSLEGIAVGDEVRLRWTGYPGVPQWLSGGSAKIVRLLNKRVVIEASAELGVRRTIDRDQLVTSHERIARSAQEAINDRS